MTDFVSVCIFYFYKILITNYLESNMKFFPKPLVSIVCGLLLLMMGPLAGVAQDKPEFFAAADVTSSYVWRGFQEPDSWGSIQPTAGVSWKSFSLSMWAMTTIKSGLRELDVNLAYEWKNWNVSLNDYYFFDDVSYFKNWWDAHSLEASVGYSFGDALPLSISFNTFILGNSDKNPLNNNRYFSSYLQADYSFNAGPLEMLATLGFCPWNSPWMSSEEGFQVTNVGIKAIYPFEFSSIPVKAWGQLTYNPSLMSNRASDGTQRGIYPVAGLSFEF